MYWQKYEHSGDFAANSSNLVCLVKLYQYHSSIFLGAQGLQLMIYLDLPKYQFFHWVTTTIQSPYFKGRNVISRLVQQSEYLRALSCPITTAIDFRESRDPSMLALMISMAAVIYSRRLKMTSEPWHKHQLFL